jgi:multiple sugar transport system substrate-binding protein
MKKIIVVLCIVAMLLAACGGPNATEAPLPTEVPTAPVVEQETKPTAEPETEQVTIRFVLFDWERSVYEDLIEVFEAENPDIKVQVVSANEALGLSGLTDFDFPEDASRRLASAADIVNGGATRQDVEEGLVRDLTPFIQADPNFQSDDFYPNTLEAYQWDGGTWSLPTSLNFQLIYFDKDAFDEAGIPYPEIGWNWDDFLAKAKGLTASEGGEVSRWGFVPSSGTDRTLVESQVGLVIDDSTDPPTPRFDEPEVFDAVQWYADLFLKEQVAPYFEPQEELDELALPEEQTLIDKRQAAMWPESDITWWYRNQQGATGAVPFPADSPDAHSTPAGTQSLSMSAGTQQPEAAWRFLDFLSRQVISTFGPQMQSLPARRSVAETSGFWDSVDEEIAAALRYTLDHYYRPRSIPGYEAFSDAMRAILSGEQSVGDALIEAQTKAEAEIQGEMAAQAEATPAPTVVVAPPEEEGPVSEGAVEITFVPGLGSLNLEPYRALARQFHESHPDIAVEVKMIDVTGASAPDLPGMAEAADCFQWYPGFQDAKNREAILNLNPFLDADPSFTTDDFFPQVLEQFTWQGQLWGLPADITPYIIEYNKDLFDAAGLDYPALDWTPDEFLELAVALTQGEDEETKQYGFVGEYYALNDLLFMAERLGAKLVDQDADPPALAYNDPDTVEAVRWYADLTTEYGVKPVFLTDISNLAGASTALLGREALINDGRAAMWTSSGAMAAIFGPREGMNLGAAPLPAEPGVAGGGYSQASGYFISADTENREACWQWITYLTGQAGAVQGLPARISVTESNEYREQVGASQADAYVASLGDAEEPSAFQVFSDEEWLGGALFWLGQAFGQVLEGEASVEEALDTAQKLADDYRACVIAAGDFGSETWQACAQEVDPTLPSFLFSGGG